MRILSLLYKNVTLRIFGIFICSWECERGGVEKRIEGLFGFDSIKKEKEKD